MDRYKWCGVEPESEVKNMSGKGKIKTETSPYKIVKRLSEEKSEARAMSINDDIDSAFNIM